MINGDQISKLLFTKNDIVINHYYL